MRPTRRFVGVAGLGVVLASLAVIAERPLLLLAAAGVGAWLLSMQYAAVRAFTATDDALTVSLTPLSATAAVDEAVLATLDVDLAVPADAAVTVTAPSPVAADPVPEADRTVQIRPDETGGQATFQVAFPVAGAFTLPDPVIEYRDPSDIASEHTTREGDAVLRVEPRQPRNVHLGQGGDRFTGAYGEHPTGETGAGLIPDRLRQYVSGDPAGRIDWKATARAGEPHVREFEAESDRKTLLVFDHRAAMATGPEGETMLEYAREIALALAQAAASFSDPLGLFAVGDDGLTQQRQASSAPQHYRQIRETLYALEPTPAANGSDTSAVEDSGVAAATRTLRRLDGEQTDFAATLTPYLGDRGSYVTRMQTDPLVGAIDRLRAEARGSLWTVVLTDDTRRARTLEAATLASHGDEYVLVVLTPRVLFEPGGLGDLEAAFERYRDFEAFRRRLQRLPRVTAVELGPGDRLDAILAANRRRRNPKHA